MPIYYGNPWEYLSFLLFFPVQYVSATKGQANGLAVSEEHDDVAELRVHLNL